MATSHRHRRSAGLLRARASVTVGSAADGRRPPDRRDRQWDTRRSHRARPAALDPRRHHLGRRSYRRRLGRQTRSAIRGRGPPASALSAPISAPEVVHAEPRGISQTSSRPRRLPALGGARRERRGPQQGRLLPALGAVPRTRSRFRNAGPNSSASPHGSTMPCGVSAPAGRSSSKHNGLPQRIIRSAPFPIRPQRSSISNGRTRSRKPARISRAGIF